MATNHDPGPELDAEVAEKVMGWEPRKLCQEGIDEELLGEHTDPECLCFQDAPVHACTYIEKGVKWEACPYGVKESTPAYSTSIAAAWEVWESPRLQGTQRLTRSVSRQYTATCYANGHKGEATADTAPLAICLAALAAVEEQ